MVDLRESMRPVDPGDPLPIGELAARAGRRRRRRAAAVSGLAAVAIGLVSLAVVNLANPSSNPIVADGPADEGTEGAPPDDTGVGQGQDDGVESSETTAPAEATPTTTPSDDATDPDPATGGSSDEDGNGDGDGNEPNSGEGSGNEGGATVSTVPTDLEAPVSDPGEDGDGPATTPGLTMSTTTTSAWEDGYCVQFDIRNTGPDRQVWQAVLDLEGTVAEVWNATAEPTTPGRYVFTGLAGFNTELGSGATTSFGTCVDTVNGASGPASDDTTGG